METRVATYIQAEVPPGPFVPEMKEGGRRGVGTGAEKWNIGYNRMCIYIYRYIKISISKILNILFRDNCKL